MMLEIVEDYCLPSGNKNESQLKLNEKKNFDHIKELSGFFDYIENPSVGRPSSMQVPAGCSDVEWGDLVYIEGLGTCYYQSDEERERREREYNEATLQGYEAIGLQHNQYKQQRVKKAGKGLNLALIYGVGGYVK